MGRLINNLISWPLLIISCVLSYNVIAGDRPVFVLKIKDHLFYPSEIEVPARQKIKLLVINEDPTAEEFESYKLNREKIILGNRRAIIFIGPLKSGSYPFFGEFNMSTAQGTLIAK